MDKQITYVDLDGVLVDLIGAVYNKYAPALGDDSFDIGQIIDQDASLFLDAAPLPGAVEAFKALCNAEHLDVYILSTAPWDNPGAWTNKRLWVEKHLGQDAHKRLILSHNKHLCHGDFLIDDRTKNGADKFNGELIQFGNNEFPTWEEVLNYLGANK